ncbi:MAG TPA: hypothetical protein VIL95_02855 [Bacillota bacterium]
MSLSVGINGKDGDPTNRMDFGVLAVALGAGLGRPCSGPAELVALNGMFVALLGGAAWFFGRAARG